jgi:hypothetical protein
MKTPFKSASYQALGLGIIFLSLVACGTQSKKSEKKDYSTLPEEVSMKEDRQILDDLRKEIPEDIKQDNDEYAFLMKMMGEVRERPEKIRDRWNTETRRRRDKYSKINQRDRDNFNKEEKKAREEFLRAANKERDSKVKSGMKADERKEFFNEQETKRREFFANQQDARRDFESQIRQRTSDFEAMMRDKNSEFNTEHRAYSDRYRQWEKDKKEFDTQKKNFEQQKRESMMGGNGGTGAANGASQAPPAVKGHYDYEEALREFDKVPKGNQTPLGAGPQDGQ